MGEDFGIALGVDEWSFIAAVVTRIGQTLELRNTMQPI
jgi:hypothetical protein